MRLPLPEFKILSPSSAQLQSQIFNNLSNLTELLRGFLGISDSQFYPPNLSFLTWSHHFQWKAYLWVSSWDLGSHLSRKNVSWKRDPVSGGLNIMLSYFWHRFGKTPDSLTWYFMPSIMWVPSPIPRLFSPIFILPLDQKYPSAEKVCWPLAMVWMLVICWNPNPQPDGIWK